MQFISHERLHKLVLCFLHKVRGAAFWMTVPCLSKETHHLWKPAGPEHFTAFSAWAGFEDPEEACRSSCLDCNWILKLVDNASIRLQEAIYLFLDFPSSFLPRQPFSQHFKVPGPEICRWHSDWLLSAFRYLYCFCINPLALVQCVDLCWSVLMVLFIVNSCLRDLYTLFICT